MVSSSQIPLRVLIHIPKTAGTTLNAALKTSGPGRKHIERDLPHRDRFARIVKRSSWVSGHVPYRAMRTALSDATPRPLQVFTMVRDPVAQLASHYNWWFVVYHRGPQSFWRQGRYFRDLSRQIRTADATNPAAIAAILLEHHALFLNMQAKYLLDDSTHDTPDSIRARLSEFTHVARNDDLAPLFTAMHLPPPSARADRNISPYYFDPSVFRSPQMHDFLSQHHARDLALWDTLTASRTA